MQDRDTDTPLDSLLAKDSVFNPSSTSTCGPVPLEGALPNPSIPQIHLFKSQIILNPTISRINFTAFLFFSGYLALILIPVGLLAIPLLTIVYGLSQSEAINVLTIVQLCQLAYKFIVFPILGALCDKYGRKPFIIAGALLMNAAIFITPHLPGVYPWFILVAIAQDLGMTSMMIPPLLADYIDYETKGRVAGVVAVIAALASFIATFATSIINVQDNIESEYHIIGIGGLAIGIIIALGIKGGAYHKSLYFDKKAEEAKQKAAQQIEEEKRRESQDYGSVVRNGIGENDNNIHMPIVVSQEVDQALQPSSSMSVTRNEKPGFKIGIKEAQRNPWILTGYISNFLFFAAIMLVNTVLVNFVTAVTGNPSDANQAYNLTNKQVLVQLFSGLFFGFGADRFNKFKILLFVLVSSIIAVILIIVSPTPYNFIAYISMVFFGISLSGFLTFVGQVVNKYANPKYRASVNAMSSMCSITGGAMTSILGMFLSKYDPYIPFYLYLGSAVIGLCILIRIYFVKIDILSKL